MQDGADAVPACEAASALRVKSKAESNREAELVCELGNAGWDASCATWVASNVDLKGRQDYDYDGVHGDTGGSGNN